MKYISITFLFLLLVPEFVLAQNQQSDKKMSIDELMQEKIRLLKDGALLVRLQTKTNSINALKQAGNIEKANQVEVQQKTFNKTVIAAFRSQFNFCPVYFFESQYSEKLLEGKMEEVIFLNDNLQPDQSIHIAQKEFLTAEIGPIESDTAAYFDDKHYDYSGKGLEKEKGYYSGADMGFDALKIMNSRFVQLKKPFPYYVRTYDPYPSEKKLKKVVTKMNTQLTDYYLRNKQ
jgi:hypothetical protein